MKKILLFTLIFGSLQVLFGANEFDGINNTITSLDSAAKSSLGVGGKWFFAILPFMVGFGIGWRAYSNEAKKSDNEKDSKKLALVAGTWFIIGVAIAMLLITLFGAVFMGNSSLAIEVMRTQIRSIFGV
ncbi:hypothetical protein [Helicobacter sp. MIT 14-3879]|uniref:hypothetical protein n=1 Tax=Helicobacter sp. MIT 14-3879 TaxID=2040649 RepID=UPI000E1ECBCD|nr:hypothetical protein [Helicobacter sp. MIT 14-3879]RDU61844.1 hypothetical protein CQA44_07915 [Helicobacter sp. MIT 14-3879]